MTPFFTAPTSSRILAILLYGGLLLASGAVAGAAETEWQVGLSAVRITPEKPLPMCGYNPNVSEGVLDDLYAKAMAIQDAEGSLAVLLTADLLFFRAPFAEVVCDQIMERTGLQREQILLNASHTHAGPVFGIEDPGRFDLPKDQRQRVNAYTEKTHRSTGAVDPRCDRRSETGSALLVDRPGGLRDEPTTDHAGRKMPRNGPES